MFTGIVKDIREIRNFKKEADSLLLEIEKPFNFPLNQGSSVAVNGVCLTVRKLLNSSFLVEIMKETLGRTTFGGVLPAKVNLEPSLKVGDTLDGHFVLGHVDAVGTIQEIQKGERSWKIIIKHPEKDSRMIVPRGSIAVNGVSLTVSGCKSGQFSFNLVDYTIKNTTFLESQEGDIVNIEYDLLGKYVLNRNV